MTLPQIAIAALKKHCAEQPAIKLRIGDAKWNSEDLIFPDATTGEPWRPSLLTFAFRRLAKRANFPNIHFHSLRHSHATQLLASGTHAKVTVTPRMQEAAADAIDAAYAGIIG